LRDRLTTAAIKLAKAANYTNAGTVEFLVEGSLSDPTTRFSFIELNPRVQVEHTITEQVTGVDIVQSQFMLAAGHSLCSLGLTDVPLLGGYSLQARITLDPSFGSSASLDGYHEPSGPGVRMDSAAYAGLTPSTQYDPLIAKLIVTSPKNVSMHHNTDGSGSSSNGSVGVGGSGGGGFEQLLKRTNRALDEYWVEGLGTSIPLIKRVLGHARFLVRCSGVSKRTHCD
jgi:pyruvate carboxylase